MSTRSYIIVQRKRSDGRPDPLYEAIYCHSDGYLSWNGYFLNTHYRSRELAEALVSMGDASYIKQEIGEAHALFPAYENGERTDSPPKNQSGFYHRDRGDNWSVTKPRVYNNLRYAIRDALNSWAEYVYFYGLDDRWYALGKYAFLAGDESPFVLFNNEYGDRGYPLPEWFPLDALFTRYPVTLPGFMDPNSSALNYAVSHNGADFYEE